MNSMIPFNLSKKKKRKTFTNKEKNEIVAQVEQRVSTGWGKTQAIEHICKENTNLNRSSVVTQKLMKMSLNG